MQATWQAVDDTLEAPSPRPRHRGGGRRTAANSLSPALYKLISDLVLFDLFLRQNIFEVVHVNLFALC